MVECPHHDRSQAQGLGLKIDVLSHCPCFDMGVSLGPLSILYSETGVNSCYDQHDRTVTDISLSQGGPGKLFSSVSLCRVFQGMFSRQVTVNAGSQVFHIPHRHIHVQRIKGSCRRGGAEASGPVSFIPESRRFNWDSAVGKSLPGEDFPPHRVIGVVEDFNFESLRNEVRPAVLVLDPSTLERGISDESTTYAVGLLNFINVRIKPDNVQKTVKLLKETWENIAPQQPFLFSFLDQDVNRQYQGIEHWSRIVGYASGFAVLIACLGLFGLAALSVSNRIKEIGIRKVVGDTTTDIVLMLSSEYVKIVVLANIIAWPLSYFVMSQWLQDFACRANINLFKFILASVIALTIALITVSYQAVKAGLKDPVESIRYE